MVKPLYSTFIYMNMQVPEPSAPRREASRPLRPAELYSKLSVPAAGKSIRLLDLQALPSKKTGDDHPLIRQLRVVRLIDSPRYAALSYV